MMLKVAVDTQFHASRHVVLTNAIRTCIPVLQGGAWADFQLSIHCIRPCSCLAWVYTGLLQYTSSSIGSVPTRLVYCSCRDWFNIAGSVVPTNAAAGIPVRSLLYVGLRTVD
jgi:hypothetical protein